MSTLPKPTKTIKYNDLRLDLFQSKIIIKMLGKKYDTFITWEKEGMFPKPLFLNGNRRYYTSFELDALAGVIQKHGLPRMELGKDNEFTLDLKERWRDIRAHILNNKYPPSPLKLQFNSVDDFKKCLRESLGVFGLRGEVQADNVADFLISKAKVV